LSSFPRSGVAANWSQLWSWDYSYLHTPQTSPTQLCVSLYVADTLSTQTARVLGSPWCFRFANLNTQMAYLGAPAIAANNGTSRSFISQFDDDDDGGDDDDDGVEPVVVGLSVALALLGLLGLVACYCTFYFVGRQRLMEGWTTARNTELLNPASTSAPYNQFNDTF
jgi:hypothetical protein